MFARLSENLRLLASQADALAGGDLENSVFQAADQGNDNRVLAGSIEQVRENLKGLAADTAMLAKAATDGRLGVR